MKLLNIIKRIVVPFLFVGVAFAQENQGSKVIKQELLNTTQEEKEKQTVTIDAKLHRQKISYRNTYKHLKRLANYPHPKDLLEVMLLVAPKDKEINMDGVVLKLVSKSVNVTIPVDRWGRAFFPLLIQAYEENAEIVANRGEDTLSLLTNIQVKPLESKQYTLAYLEKACEQTRVFLDKENSWLSSIGRQMRNSHCIGVDIFAFDYDSAAPPHVKFVQDNGVEESLSPSGKPLRILFKDWRKDGHFFIDEYPLRISLVVEEN